MGVATNNAQQMQHPQNIKRFYLSQLTFIFLLTLLGCASTPIKPNLDNTITAPYATNFTIQARVSIRVGEKRDTVKLDWTRSPPTETIKIFTPFGAQLAEINATQDGATLKYKGTNNTESVGAATVADLTQSALGTRLDTNLLARWVQGYDLDRADNFAVFPESGVTTPWKVEAEEYRLIDGARVASRLTAISGDTVVRVVIDEFRKL